MSTTSLRQTITLLLLTSTCFGIVFTDLPPIFNETLLPLRTLEYKHEASDPRITCSHYEPHNDYLVLQNGSLALPRSGEVLEFDSFYLTDGTAYVCTDSKPRTLTDEHEASDPCQLYEPHHDFILLQNLSLILPRSGDVFGFDSYHLVNGTAYICTDGEEGMLSTEPQFEYSKEFIECGHLLIEPHEYRVLDNGDVYVEVYRITYGPRDYYMKSPDEGIFICVPRFDEMHLASKFPPVFSYVTYAGLLVSQVALLAHLAVFCWVPAARNLPGCCLASLSLALLAAYSCFLAIAAVDSEDNRTCADLGMAVYYFFLTAFFWMNAIAFDVWRSFRSVMRELRISSHRVPWRRFLLYSLYAWALPAVLTCTVKILDTHDIVPDDFRPKFGSTFCWFGQRKPLLVFFAVPLVVVMVLNAAFFLDVTCVISRAALKTSHEANLRKRFFMFMRLALIMGLTWIVGLVAGYVNHAAVWCAFIVLNTLQGLFIFVVFSCSSKVKGLLLCCRRGKYRHAMKRGSTSIRISHISAQV